MRQQINLYQPALFEKKVHFSSRLIALLLIAGLACALLVGGGGMWHLSKLKSKLARLQADQDAALQRVAEYQRRYPPRRPDPDLAQKVDQMMADRQARLALLDFLTEERPVNGVGFSSHLEGLAKEDVPTVWLRRIRLSGGGHDLLLEGSATRASDVPVYLQRLQRQQDYVGREFDHLQLSRSENNPQAVDFLLQTTKEKKP